MGRFNTAPFEINHMGTGIDQDLQNPVGQYVDWWIYDPEETTRDPIYEVGSYDGGGRRWREPFRVNVVMATIIQGPQYQNERGFYTSDDLALVLNATEFYSKLPHLAFSPDPYLLDRIDYRGELFAPTLIYPKGHIHDHLVVCKIEAQQVKPEEIVNDPQFSKIYGE